jgi:hypothetical protein
MSADDADRLDNTQRKVSTMEDQNQNMIPDRWDRMIVRVAMIVAALLAASITALGEAGTPTPLWLGLLSTAIPLGVTFFSIKSPKVGGPTAAVLLVLILALAAAGCHWRAAWTTLDGVRKARLLMADTLAHQAAEKHAECAKLGEGTEAYRKCIAHHHMLLTKWQQPTRIALVSGERVTALAVSLAQDKGNKKLDWKAAAKPLACAVARAGRDWGPYIPKEADLLLLAAAGLEVATCPKSNAVAGGANEAGAILAAFGALISYIAATLSEPVEAIRKRVEAELAKPIVDATDPVLRIIVAALPKAG